jgi:hypothetical protein
MSNPLHSKTLGMQLAALVPSCAATQDQYLEKKTVRPTDDAILGHMQQA